MRNVHIHIKILIYAISQKKPYALDGLESENHGILNWNLQCMSEPAYLRHVSDDQDNACIRVTLYMLYLDN